MSNMEADKLVRERIVAELELISVTATSNGTHATTRQRWDRIYHYLKQLGWKYRKGGLDGFVYQPPGSQAWLSCEAAATLFATSLPHGVTLVYECSRRGVTRGQKLSSTTTAAASTGGVKEHHEVPPARPRKITGQSKPNAIVIPGTQDEPMVNGNNDQCHGEELVSSGKPLGTVKRSRSGILKRGFKSTKLPKGSNDTAHALENPLGANEPLQTVGPILYEPGVWKLQEKPFEFVDPLPGPPTFADEERKLNDEAVKDNLCRRNPKRKGRPNDKVVQAQLACGSDDDISSESASPVPSDDDESDCDDSSPRRAKACPVFTPPNLSLTLSLTVTLSLTPFFTIG